MNLTEINKKLQMYFSNTSDVDSVEISHYIKIKPESYDCVLKYYTDGSKLKQYSFAVISDYVNTNSNFSKKEMIKFNDHLETWIKEMLDKHAYPKIDGIQSLEMIGSEYAEVENQEHLKMKFRLTYLEK